MDLVPFLAPLKLIHVLAALAFVLAHGTSTAVSLRLRTLRDRATIVAYLDLSERTMGATYAALLVVFAGGIISGIAGGYWTSGRLWLWASLAIFIGIAFEMSFVRWRYLLRVPQRARRRPRPARWQGPAPRVRRGGRCRPRLPRTGGQPHGRPRWDRDPRLADDDEAFLIPPMGEPQSAGAF